MKLTNLNLKLPTAILHCYPKRLACGQNNCHKAFLCPSVRPSVYMNMLQESVVVCQSVSHLFNYPSVGLCLKMPLLVMSLPLVLWSHTMLVRKLGRWDLQDNDVPSIKIFCKVSNKFMFFCPSQSSWAEDEAEKYPEFNVQYPHVSIYWMKMKTRLDVDFYFEGDSVYQFGGNLHSMALVNCQKYTPRSS